MSVILNEWEKTKKEIERLEAKERVGSLTQDEEKEARKLSYYKQYLDGLKRKEETEGPGETKNDKREAVKDEFNLNQNTQRQLLALLFDSTILQDIRHIIKPESWSDSAHKKAAKAIIQFYDKYGKSPEIEILQNDLEQEFSDLDPLVRDKWLAEIKYVWDYKADKVESKEYYLDELLKFTRIKLLQIKINENLDYIKKNKDITYSLQDDLEMLKTLSVKDSETDCYDAYEFLDMADAIERNWIIDNVLCQGSMHLFSASKKAGKSTLNHSLIPALMTGNNWFFNQVKMPMNVIYIDYENPADYVAQNLAKFISLPDLKEHRHKLKIPKKLPRGITAEYISSLLKKHNYIPAETVVFIDSGRRAFNKLCPGVPGWDNTNSEVSRVLQPIVELCHSTQLTTVLVHHNNKSGGIAGNEAWAENCDYIWQYEIKSDNSRKLKFMGRYSGATPSPLIVQKLLNGSITMGYEKGLDESPDTEESPPERLQKVWDALPGEQDKALSLGDIGEKIGLTPKTCLKAVRELGGIKFITGERGIKRYWKESKK